MNKCLNLNFLNSRVIFPLCFCLLHVSRLNIYARNLSSFLRPRCPAVELLGKVQRSKPCLLQIKLFCKMPVYHIHVITWALLIADYDITKFLSCMHHKITLKIKFPGKSYFLKMMSLRVDFQSWRVGSAIESQGHSSRGPSFGS